MQPRAKERKERRAKEKASMARRKEKMEKEAPRMEQPILQILPKVAPLLLPQRLSTPTTWTSTTFLSWPPRIMKHPSSRSRLTPTSMVLDLGCTRAMTSRVAAQDLMKFCDQNKDCGIWYNIAETQSKFTFANSESTQCKQKLVICMYDREFAVQSTEFDIVEQGHVPTLMSLPQMRNLRFQFDLQPDKAFLSSPILGIENMQLRVAPSSHLVLDLIDFSDYMWQAFGLASSRSRVSPPTTCIRSIGSTRKIAGGSSLEEEPEEPEDRLCNG